MSNAIWRGGATNIRPVADLPITNDGTNWATSDTITLTIGAATFVVTVGSLVTKAQVATTVYQAYMGITLTDTSALSSVSVADGGAISIPQFAEWTATNGTSEHVTFTGNQGTTTDPALMGKPITMSVSKSSTHGTVSSYSNTSTTPTSQAHGDNANNYAAGSAPANNDTVIFDSGSADMRYGLSLGVQLAALTKYKAYSGNVGLPYINKDSSSKPYPETRTRYLTTNNNSVTCTANLELGDGPGSGRFMWDYGAGRTDVFVFGKGQRADTGVPCLLLKGTHASNTVSNLAGDVGLAFFGGETATIATISTGDGPQSQASTICGSGCTLTTVKLNGGYQQTNSAVTTATQYAGIWDHYSGTITTLTVYGGTFAPRGTCTITTGTVYGKIDLSHTAGTVTFTNLVNLYGTAEIYDPNAKAVFSAGYKLNSTTAKVTRPSGDTHSLS